MRNPTENDLDALVRREVACCVSVLVYTLSQGYGNLPRGELDDLAEQAFDLACPIDDYESAAREDGWEFHPLYGIRKRVDDDWESAVGWQDACHGSGVFPHQSEVFEHWVISGWLADKLEQHGEKVDRDFAGLVVWARTTTGQAIAMDWVIDRIWRDLHKTAD